jgi:tRNA A37 threonylcarbamoyladenosine synthetase subunit TsaC/SUA5/YrdC
VTPLFDVAGDAARAFAALEAGGIAVVPNDIGYSVLGGSAAALRRIFRTKGRRASKRNALVANAAWHDALHMCSTRGREIVQAITVDYDLPLGCIAPYRRDHPAILACDGETVADSSQGGTIAMLLNAGRFHAALTALSYAGGKLLFGSSANLTLTGTRFCVEDIPPEITGIADVVIDHGLQRYHPYAASSTLLDVETLEVVRHGSCFADIAYVLRRHFGVMLPAPREATAAGRPQA